jgi:hypothetical protein
MAVLICNCCGCSTKGKQWWNRDKGYGLCKSCGEWKLKQGQSIEMVQEDAGIRGINWDIK